MLPTPWDLTPFVAAEGVGAQVHIRAATMTGTYVMEETALTEGGVAAVYPLGISVIMALWVAGRAVVPVIGWQMLNKPTLSADGVLYAAEINDARSPR
jgi:hypothetical protein